MLDTLMTNETIDEVKRRKKKSLVFKVDFEKAYNCVCWEFLLYMLETMGFNGKWVSWIKNMLSSSSISILVNESLTGEFKSTRGLRQGDPIAPFLFLVVVEGLSGLMRQALLKGLYKGYKVGKQNAELSLLQFADDTLFFVEDSLQNVLCIKSILRSFKMVSGLKINFHKSSIGGIGVVDTLLHRYALFLNCSYMDFPFVYLGVPIGANPRRKSVWSKVLEKCRKKLSVWRQKTLSLGGRVTFINLVFSSIPLFFLSFLKIFVGVAKKIISSYAKEFFVGWG